MKLLTIAALGASALIALTSTRSPAQVPPQGQGQLPGGLPAGMTPDQLAQLLQQNPQLGDQIRQRLQQTGLRPDQVRAQLAAAGYPPNLLDAYLGTGLAGQAAPTPSSQTLAALQLLGISTNTLVAIDTGMVRLPAEPV